VLKPLSAAISIGSGGPFGAEGPIIMTGGAVGSLVAQLLHLSSAERKTLLVAGAAGGMAATFGSPIAAVLLSVELLLFEWKPRSLVPVACASATATILRHYLLGGGPLFPVPAHHAFIGIDGFLACIVVGLSAGALSALLTKSVYLSEDAFQKLPVHWMWWPAIGGLLIGAGGLIAPRSLGVGYNTIGDLLHGDLTTQVVLAVLLVKWFIWSGSLGSGTSGGVLAPLLLIGGALGGLEATFLPHEGAGFWPMIAMGAMLGGTMRVPLTSMIFVIELTHDTNALLPLLIGTSIAYAFTVLLLDRSILTEKISRRGHHLTREYVVDPLELIRVRDVMDRDVNVLPFDALTHHARAVLSRGGNTSGQRLYPIIDAGGAMVGVATRTDLQRLAVNGNRIDEIVNANPVVAHPDELLRAAVDRMVQTGMTRLPVVCDGAHREFAGMLRLQHVLKARAMALEWEERRERALRFPWMQRTFEAPS
jgi:H+/Cl- antiporter ClcA/CBS domain-containing protein